MKYTIELEYLHPVKTSSGYHYVGRIVAENDAAPEPVFNGTDQHFGFETEVKYELGQRVVIEIKNVLKAVRAWKLGESLD